MFEIGSTLQEARRRRGLALADVEAATRIRAKYLAALEEDRFDALPGEAYAKAFLRGYARYLGLDEEFFVDEFTARFPAQEEPLFPERSALSGRRWRLSNSLLLPLLAIFAVAVLIVVAWQFGSRGPSVPSDLAERASRPAANVEGQPTTGPAVETATSAVRPAKPGAKRATLVLHATFGDCWLSVRLRSRSGRVLSEGFLRQGESLRFAKTPLWIRLGAPQNLTARLNGTPVKELPEDTANVLVTGAGIRILSAG